DARIATAESRFGLAPARLGLRYSPQDCARLVAAVGLNGARRLLLGEPIDAAEAQRIGLVDELVPPEGLERRARELAGHWLGLAPEAVAGIRRSLAALVESLARAAEPLWGEFYGAFRSEEFQEGVRAFLGKRPPRWSG
ncbi:MAG: enoyl-CoA hydratase-related protein, partial [Geminicoccaceae bacterium]|nr:enoyl-CoA hydratase-related protein [Geminicoccaceae bacterium]